MQRGDDEAAATVLLGCPRHRTTAHTVSHLLSLPMLPVALTLPCFHRQLENAILGDRPSASKLAQVAKRKAAELIRARKAREAAALQTTRGGGTAVPSPRSSRAHSTPRSRPQSATRFVAQPVVLDGDQGAAAERDDPPAHEGGLSLEALMESDDDKPKLTPDLPSDPSDHGSADESDSATQSDSVDSVKPMVPPPSKGGLLMIALGQGMQHGLPHPSVEPSLQLTQGSSTLQEPSFTDGGSQSSVLSVFKRRFNGFMRGNKAAGQGSREQPYRSAKVEPSDSLD